MEYTIAECEIRDLCNTKIKNVRKIRKIKVNTLGFRYLDFFVKPVNAILYVRIRKDFFTLRKLLINFVRYIMISFS